MIETVLSSFGTILQLQNLIAMVVGVTAGITIGAIPGLTGTMAIALLLPVTFYMPPITAIAMLLGLYKGSTYGGSISAILLSAPGTPAAAATVLDGYPLAQQGKAGKALKIALYASVIADTLSCLILITLVGQLAKIALMFGPAEFFSLTVFALTIVGLVSGRSLIKGLLAAVLGLIFSTVGFSPVAGVERFTFGWTPLSAGFNLIVVLIGLFAVSEVIMRSGMQKEHSPSKKTSFWSHTKTPDHRVSWPEFRSCLPAIFRGGLIGAFIGAVPGTGASVSCFLSYGEARRASKHPEKFGKGALEGVAAAEAGNNGVTGATLIPLLSFGIPGDTVTAVLLGAFMIHGMTPGPMLLAQHHEVIYPLLAGLIVSCGLLFLIGRFALELFSLIVTNTPSKVLFPVILVLSAVGSYAINNSVFDVGSVLMFGFIGYFMRRGGFPLAPFVIAFVISPIMERSLRQAMIISAGSWFVFFKHPLSLLFLVAAALSVVGIILSKRRHRVIQQSKGG